jgi:hypothetical protein
MLKLRKIPLEPLIQILQDLYDSGADYIDISGEQNGEGESLKDIIQITVKPDYMSDPEDVVENIELDYSEDDVPDTTTRTLSDDDINNLIE